MAKKRLTDHEKNVPGRDTGSAVSGGWLSVTIGDACRIVNGGTPKTKVAEYWDGPHTWITPAEMGGRESPYISNSRRSLSEEGLAKCSASLLLPYSVILSSRAPIGHLVINEVPMATNQGCKGLVPNDELNHKFLYYYLSSIVVLLNELGSGTTFKELSATKLRSVTIPLPPLPEQERIVAILDEAFAAIATATANAEKNLANARELFESELNRVFSQKGDGWVEKPLGEVAVFQGGSQPPKATFSKECKPGYIRLIQIRDYKSDKHIVFIPEETARRKCDSTDVMIGRYGPPLFQILRGIDGAYNVALMKAIPDESQISKDYLYYFLQNGKILSYVIHSSNRAAGQAGVNKKTLEPYPIPFPVRLSDQAAIVEQLERVITDSECLKSIHHKRLTALTELKQSILHKAFTGELTADPKATDRTLSEAGL